MKIRKILSSAGLALALLGSQVYAKDFRLNERANLLDRIYKGEGIVVPEGFKIFVNDEHATISINVPISETKIITCSYVQSFGSYDFGLNYAPLEKLLAKEARIRETENPNYTNPNISEYESNCWHSLLEIWSLN